MPRPTKETTDMKMLNGYLFSFRDCQFEGFIRNAVLELLNTTRSIDLASPT